MNPTYRAILFCTFALAASLSQGATITWINTAGGKWSDQNNWSPNQVPGGGDDAFIISDGTYTVTVDAAEAVSNLTVGGSSGLQSLDVPGTTLTIVSNATFGSFGSLDFNGGLINGTGSLTFAGSNYWSSGKFNNSGANTINGSGTLVVDTGGNHDFPTTTWTNLGVVTHTGGQLRGGGLGTTFYNNGLWLEETDNQLEASAYGGAITFYNVGTFQKTTTGGQTTFEPQCYLINTGTVDAETGSIVIDDGGGSSSGGTFFANTNGTVDFANTYNFTGDNTFSGPGTVEFDTGSVITYNGNLITTNLQWVEAVIKGNITNIAGNVLYLSTGNNHDLPSAMFVNNGTIMHTGGEVRGGGATPTTFYNNGLWLEETDNQLEASAYGGAFVFYNVGMFQKTTTGGQTTFEPQCYLINTSTVDAESGEIVIDDGGGSSSGGTFFANAAGTIEFANTYNFTGDNTFSGPGTVEFNTGQVITYNGNLITTNLQWVAANIEGNITNIAGNVLYLTTGNNHDLESALFVNNGTIMHTGGAVRGGGATPTTFYNNGLWLEETDNQFNNAFGGTVTFYNVGTFQKTTTTGQTTFEPQCYLINTSTVDAETGTIEINDGGGSSSGGTFFANTAGTIDFVNTYYFTGDNTFSGPGTVEFNTGQVITYNGNLITTNLQWVAAVIEGNITNIAGNVLYLTTGNNHNLPSAMFVNNGTIMHTGGEVRGGGATPTTFYNNGLWLEETDNQFNNAYGGTVTYYNVGTFQKTTTTGTTTFEPQFYLINSGTVDAESGTIVIDDQGGMNNGGTFNAGANGECDFVANYTFSDGSVFSGAGINYIDCGGDTVTFQGGFRTTNLIWNSGLFGGTPTNLINGILTLVSGNNHNFPGALFRNLGTIIHTGGSVRGGLGGVFDNSGLWLEETDNQFSAAYGGVQSFINNSIFTKTNSTSTTTFDPQCYLINNGQVNAATGTIAIDDEGGNSQGTFMAAGGAECHFVAPYTFNTGTIFSGAGQNVIDANVIFAGSFFSYNLQWDSGWITGNGTNLPGSTIFLVSGNNHDLAGAYLNNLGTITHSAGAVRSGLSGTINNGGVWLEQTDNQISAAYGGVATFLNNGTFSKAGTGGATTFGSGMNFANNNSGILQVLSGSVVFAGAYTQNNGTMQFGLTSTANYGTVGLTSPVALNGTLGTILQGGYTPALGDSFTPLTYPSRTAEFNNLNLSPVPAGDAWQVTYNPANLNLKVIAPSSGAYQITGSVNDAPTHGVPGITVFAFNTNGAAQAIYVSTVTDANGLYSLAVSNSTWYVGLENLPAAGYNPVPDQTAVVSGGSQVVNFLIQAIGAVGPVATTTAASSLSQSGATLNGTVTPGGEAVSVYFAYGTTALDHFTPTNTITTALSGTQGQSAPLSGLAFATQYQFQIVAVNSIGSSFGSVLNFTTLGSTPVTMTLPATDVGTTNATMNGSVNPDGLATLYYFEYGITTNYLYFTPTNALGAGTIALAVANTLTNLSPATVYHFQLVASNADGITLGGDLTWTNTNTAPTVTTLAATTIGTTTATLNGSINPNGLDTAWYFEYGTDISYGSFTPTNTITATNTSQSLASALASLAPDTIYHFQLVGSNALGVVLGGDLSFTNSAVPATITCPADIATNSAPETCSQWVSFAPIAGGVPAPTVTCTLGGTPITSPFEFPVGTNVVSCTASNEAGQQTCSFNVIVFESAPPIAGPNQLGTYEATPASVDVAKVLLRDRAPNGGTLSITAVAPTTPEGGSVSLGGGKITYTPGGGFVGADTLTYTLSDGCGTASGTIALTVLSTNLPAMNQVSISASPGEVTIVFAGVPGAKYIVQWAPTLDGAWTDLNGTPITAEANGLVQITDTYAGPTRYYRTRYVSGP